MRYLWHLLITLDMYLIMALSLNLLVGYCGLFSLAQAGFFAIGSYSYALATLSLGWTFLPAAMLGILVAAVFSLLLSLPAARIRGDLFVILSLAMLYILLGVLQNSASTLYPLGTIRNLTNGPLGIAGIPKPVIFGRVFSSVRATAAVATFAAAFCAWGYWILQRSPWGRLLKAQRDDETAAEGLGKSVRLARVQALAISGGTASIAGALYASYLGYIDPTLASLDDSILMLSMVVVGGAGNYKGPLLGALVLLLIPEALRFARVSDVLAADLRLLAYGALLVLMMRVRPQGLVGEYRIR